MGRGDAGIMGKESLPDPLRHFQAWVHGAIRPTLLERHVLSGKIEHTQQHQSAITCHFP